MSGWASRTAATLLATVLATSTPGASAQGGERLDGEVESSTLFTFADPEISESSGLADTGRVVLTVNDSGDGAVIYAVDPRTGETVRRTTYSTDDVYDVEALALGPGPVTWVGDIGDNAKERELVSLYAVRSGEAAARRLDLTYPDGPQDAEALLAHPRTGRLFVVSKSVFGGVVYAVPQDAAPGRTARLRPFARVSDLVTDGVFLPDGRHVVLRGYWSATVYTFPGFEALGTVELPGQEQGEGISVTSTGQRVLLSTEGVRSDVLRIELPDALVDDPADPTPSVSTSASARAEPSAEDRRTPPDGRRSDTAFALRVLAGLILLVVIGAALRRLWRDDS